MIIRTTTTGVYADCDRINCEKDLKCVISHLQQRFEWHRKNNPNKFDKE